MSRSSEGQGQINGNQFSVNCKCFCDLCVTWIVRLQLKGIPVVNGNTARIDLIFPDIINVYIWLVIVYVSYPVVAPSNFKIISKNP